MPHPDELRQTGMHLGRAGGAPCMMAGDRAVWGFVYTLDPYSNRPWLDAFRSMYQQGVRLFSFLVPLPVAWKEDGGFDFSLIDEVHDAMLEAGPEALFLPRVFLVTPPWWDARHQDELLRFCAGEFRHETFPNEALPLWRHETKLYHGPDNPSLASEAWRRDAGNALTAYVRHTWETPRYAGHWVGYQVAYGSCGEWGAYGTYLENRFGGPDVSAPMVAAYRSWLKSHYPDDESLRKAWRDPGACLAEAMPPDKAALLATDVGSLKDPRRRRAVTDWQAWFSDTLHDAIEHFCRVAKEAAPVPVLAGSFAGYRLQVGCSAYICQHALGGIGRLLASPWVDILSTPNVYHDRANGVFSQAPVQTPARHKLFLAENDVHTHLDEQRISGEGIVTPTIREEEIAQFRRDTAFNFSQGGGHQWWYDFGLGWYLDPAIEKIIAGLVQAGSSLSVSARTGQAEVALVVDEASLGHIEGMAGYFNLCRTMQNTEIPRMGAPCDIITGDDVLRRPPYKLYLFRDQFYTTTKHRRALRRFLEKHKASAVWFYAPGLVGKTGIRPDKASELTGIHLNLLPFAAPQYITLATDAHPVCKGVPHSVGTRGNEDVHGVYGPVLHVDDPRATVLGKLEALDLPGAAIRAGEGRFDAWFASPLLPWQLLANLGHAAVVHRWLEPGVALAAAGRVFTVWSDHDRTVNLAPPNPDFSEVRDLLTGHNNNVNSAGFVPLSLQTQCAFMGECSSVRHVKCLGLKQSQKWSADCLAVAKFWPAALEWRYSGTRSPGRRLQRDCPRKPSGGLFLELQQPSQLVGVDVAGEEKLDEFHHPFARTLAGEDLQQRCGDEGAIDLNGDAGRRLGQQVAAAEDALDPFEEELDLPAVAVDQGDQLGHDL